MPKVMTSPNLTTIGQISHPISPTRSPEKTQMPCQNSDTLSLQILYSFRILIWTSCPVVVDNRKMPYLPPCITYESWTLKNLKLLVQRFSNYRSLAVRPITGQNQFSELQSTFFFSFNEIENVRGYHIHRRQNFISCVHTLRMQGSQRVSMQNTLTVGHRSKKLETLY